MSRARIDAQALIAAKPAQSVVPPAVEAGLFGVTRTKRVDEAEAHELAKRGALVGVKEDVALPPLRIVYVDRFGRDVEIAAEKERLIRRVVGDELSPEAPQPVELVCECRCPHGLPVRHVDVDDPDPIDAARERAPRGRAVVAVEVLLYVIDREPVSREDRDAVVRLLAEEHGSVAGVADRALRKRGVEGLWSLASRRRPGTRSRATPRGDRAEREPRFTFHEAMRIGVG